MGFNCEEARDRFSALWENGLNPSEEREVGRHLDLCPECREEFARFHKTLRILHSFEERDVPEGFLPGIFERMERREKNTLVPGDKAKRWNFLTPPWRLPIQAVAMVAVVFITLYLTKRMPEESLWTKPEKELEPFVEEKIGSAEEKTSRVQDHKPAHVQVPRPSPVSPGPPSTGVEVKRSDEAAAVRPVKKEGDEIKALEHLTEERPEVKAKGAEEPPGASLRAEEAGKPLPPGEASFSGLNPSEEVVLKSSDPKKTISDIDLWIKNLGGETLATEGNILLVSLPGSSVLEFKRQLGKREGFDQVQKVVPSRDLEEGSFAETGVRKRGAQDQGRGILQLEGAKDLRVILRIVLVKE